MKLSYAFLIILTGCATIQHGSSQSVIIKTDPDGASCIIERDGKNIAYLSETPGGITVDKSQYTLLIKCNKSGYEEAHMYNGAFVDPATENNGWFTGPIGVIADAASGARYSYKPEVRLKLEPSDE